MIEILTGKPGAGKSYGAVCRVVRELERGPRDIVTNLPLNLDLLNAYFQKRGRVWVDVYARVRIINREQCAEFWRFRGQFTVLAGQGTSPVSDMVEISGFASVLYVIDEAHILFDARQWAKSSVALTFYNSQHRHLGDDLVFVTQFLGLLEKRVRNFAEIFTVFTNFAGRKMWNILRMPRRMRERNYGVEPGPNVVADSETWVSFQKEIGELYDTSAGVGMTGGRKPEARNDAKGLPWWSVFVAIGAAAGFFWFVPRYMGDKVVSSFTNAGSKAVGQALPSNEPTKGGKRAGNDPVAPSEPSPAVVSVSGYVLLGKDVRVYLTDGRMLEASDIHTLTSDRVMTRDGSVYYMSLRGKGLRRDDTSRDAPTSRSDGGAPRPVRGR